MAKHVWIVEVNDRPGEWEWREHGNSRGGLDVQAFRTKAEAKTTVYAAKQLYSHVRLAKFVREPSSGGSNGAT